MANFQFYQDTLNQRLQEGDDVRPNSLLVYLNHLQEEIEVDLDLDFQVELIDNSNQPGHNWAQSWLQIYIADYCV